MNMREFGYMKRGYVPRGAHQRAIRRRQAEQLKAEISDIHAARRRGEYTHKEAADHIRLAKVCYPIEAVRLVEGGEV